jgi:hypothetical protein
VDVIGFLCVSLCSSTVELHDSIGSRRACACSEAGFHSQNGSVLLYVILWEKGHIAKNVPEEMFPV